MSNSLLQKILSASLPAVLYSKPGQFNKRCLDKYLPLLEMAVSRNDLELVKKTVQSILSQDGENGQLIHYSKALACAVQHNDETDILKYLIDSGMRFDHPSAAECFTKENFYRLSNYVEMGADINQKNVEGRTQLTHWCAKPYSTLACEQVQALLEKGADPNMPDVNGCTPLFHVLDTRKERSSLAINAQEVSSKLVALLLNAGADPCALSPDGQSMIGLCCSDKRNRGIVLRSAAKLLLEKGSPIEPGSKDMRRLAIGYVESWDGQGLRILIERGLTPENDGCMLLVEAVRNQSVDCLVALLDNGWSPSIQTESGRMAMDLANRMTIEGQATQTFNPRILDILKSGIASIAAKEAIRELQESAELPGPSPWN